MYSLTFLLMTRRFTVTWWNNNWDQTTFNPPGGCVELCSICFLWSPSTCGSSWELWPECGRTLIIINPDRVFFFFSFFPFPHDSWKVCSGLLSGTNCCHAAGKLNKQQRLLITWWERSPMRTAWPSRTRVTRPRLYLAVMKTSTPGVQTPAMDFEQTNKLIQTRKKTDKTCNHCYVIRKTTDIKTWHELLIWHQNFVFSCRRRSHSWPVQLSEEYLLL